MQDVAVLVGENSIELEENTLSGYIRVTVNGQIIPISKDSLSQIQGKDGNTIALVYSLPTETIRLFFISDFELQFDGVAVKIRVSVRTLCYVNSVSVKEGQRACQLTQTPPNQSWLPI